MLAIYPLLKPPTWCNWRWNGTGWQEKDDRTSGEGKISSAEAKTQTPTPATSLQSAQDVGRPAAQIPSCWMSDIRELSTFVTPAGDSCTDEERFTDWGSSNSNGKPASGSDSTDGTDDDSISEEEEFTAQTPRESETRPIVIVDSEQKVQDRHPMQNPESFHFLEDVEMADCEWVENFAEEKMDWEWSEASGKHPLNKSPPEPSLEIESRYHPTWLPHRTIIPPSVGRTNEQEVEAVDFLLDLSRDHPLQWEILVGMYFSEGRHPQAYLGRDGKSKEVLRGEYWEWSWALQDIREQCPRTAPAPYTMPAGQEGKFLESITESILDGNEDLFLRAIKIWQLERMSYDKCALENIMKRAGWCYDVSSTREWQLMAELKKLPAGSDKAEILEQAIRELPRFAWRCIHDPNCI
ncbi:predicted protein [Histoplasma mississippiense (nom. inval.)]|uniref:predicted protein n=1 Tax=Ajellomyces capsulatus (strain NAm1 / WU24) TaxID=2059318 RepID=UPI000157C57A|nr:predicted protein [Histoplasma mississippiense (nom. inval.)]EDN08549.1 predicted protein [Histoplasma mississippiense (nom. inval.)]